MKQYNQIKANLVLDFYIDEICKFRKVEKSDVLKKGRIREFADMRAMAAYLAKNKCPGIKLHQIANYFKLVKHATALHSLKKIETLKNQVLEIKQTLEHCEKLNFVQGVLSNHGFVQIEANCFSMRVFNKILDVENFTSDSFSCDLRCSGGKQFYIQDIDIFDAIIIAQNIDKNPLGILINSLKN